MSKVYGVLSSARSSRPEVFREISQNSQKKTPVPELEADLGLLQHPKWSAL